MMSFDAFLLGIISLLGLFGVVSLIREAVDGRNAGPIRFRLPPASMATPQRGALVGTAVLALCVLMTLPAAFSSRQLSSLAAPLLLLWAAVNNFPAFLPRRHARRWLLLASGLLSLMIAATVLAVGLWAGPTGEESMFPGWPRVLVLILAVLLFAGGAREMREWHRGTLLRERGIEIFGRTHPLSRIIFKGWQEVDGESMLRLAMRAPRLFDVPFGDDRELVVPVPASERPALEAFFAAPAATVGRSRVGEEMGRLPETSSTGER
jgi:hypothetical protein